MRVYPDSSVPRKPRGLKGKDGSEEVKGLSLIGTSLRHQIGEFFNNSTLHGVRYIAEKDRPFCEKFMWFSFTAIGAVTTCIIIVSLWEKFQTNPTITGLDTDFHNWDVPFPALTLCDNNPVDPTFLQDYLDKTWETSVPPRAEEALNWLATLSFKTIAERAQEFSSDMELTSTAGFDGNLRGAVFNVVRRCEILFFDCEWKGDSEECCDLLAPVFTEMGFCYAFNSKHSETTWPWQIQQQSEFVKAFIHETDAKWSFMFNSFRNDTVIDLYIHSSEEMAGLELSAQHSWDRRVEKVSFSVKHTYTTEDARQLSIRQRRCVFADEQQLETSDIYTYSACMRQCRMQLCRQYCKCVPHFYPNIPGYRYCTLKELACIAQHVSSITDVTRCKCELGCSHTVYEVEKLTEFELEACQGPVWRQGHRASISVNQEHSLHGRKMFWRVLKLQKLLRGNSGLVNWQSSSIIIKRGRLYLQRGDPERYRYDAFKGRWTFSSSSTTKGASSSTFLETEFVSWPMVRYKREVLFGWVDLLVSFGGIAGLFLGFSLLSGVELVYYFTLRACCAAVKDADQLRRERAERLAKPAPPYNLSLVPWWKRPPTAHREPPILVQSKDSSPPQYSPPPGYTTFLP